MDSSLCYGFISLGFPVEFLLWMINIFRIEQCPFTNYEVSGLEPMMMCLTLIVDVEDVQQ